MERRVLDRQQLVWELRGLLLDEAHVRFAYLYGSRALGFERPDSDVDIAAFFAPDADIAPEWDLAERLTRELGLQVQVINLNERPAEKFFAKALRPVIVLKHSPERADWEKEQGLMEGEESGKIADYLEHVLTEMSEKSARLREALPLLDGIDLDSVNRNDIKAVQAFLGGFFLVFQPFESLARRMANYVHLTTGAEVSGELKSQVRLLGAQLGLAEEALVPLQKMVNVRNKVAHAYWNLKEEELNNDDLRAARRLLEDLAQRVDSFVAAKKIT